MLKSFALFWALILECVQLCKMTQKIPEMSCSVLFGGKITFYSVTHLLWKPPQINWVSYTKLNWFENCLCSDERKIRSIIHGLLTFSVIFHFHSRSRYGSNFAYLLLLYNNKFRACMECMCYPGCYWSIYTYGGLISGDHMIEFYVTSLHRSNFQNIMFSRF
jgi:hypothetical protein